ncbi:MAG: endolytic transglycosylase MltG [Candidatus Doudnabacteria bacterium]|nr:endolytic transglycosylase MltG [Candidatus Doudnabacteria bacterium]
MQDYQIEQPKKGKLKILSLSLALAAVLALSFFIYFFTKVNQASSTVSAPVNMTIKKGSSTRMVATLLQENKIISHSWIFIFYMRLQGGVNKIQAGDYLLDRKMSIAEVAEIVTAGKVVSNELKVTIIEGWTNKQIADYLMARQIMPSTAEFLKLADGHEGYLFPDTYKLGKEENADALIKKMLANFEKVTKDLQLDKDKIILASIIEKEVGRNKDKVTKDDLALMQNERSLVASVFYNRLKAGMPLQSDATVNYITGKTDRQVSLEDAKIKSAYNTYLVKGLPPGPIGNPGINSIKAAVFPAESDYLYFLNDASGTAYFAKTIEEHNQNRAKYLD